MSKNRQVCIKHLLCELWDSQCAVLLRTTRCQWGEASHKEVQARKWDKVDSDFAEVTVQLTWEAEAASHATHGGTDEVVEISIGRGCQLQGAKADVIKSFIVQEEALVCVLHELVKREDLSWFTNTPKETM